MKKLTMAEAEKLIRRDHPGLWERFTPQERREAVRRLNDERKARFDIEAFLRRQHRPPAKARRKDAK